MNQALKCKSNLMRVWIPLYPNYVPYVGQRHYNQVDIAEQICKIKKSFGKRTTKYKRRIGDKKQNNSFER